MKNTASHAFIADLYQKQSYAEIIGMLQHQERSVTDVNSLLMLAASYLAQGQQEEACLVCEDIYPRITRESSFYQVYGSALRRSGLYQKALDIQNEGIQSFPEDTNILNNIANTLIDIGEFEKARKILIELTNKNPQPSNIEDIKQNLERLSLIELANDTDNKPEQNIDEEKQVDGTIDPLERAFDAEELKQSSDRNESAAIESLRFKLKNANDDKVTNQSKSLELLKICSETSSKFPRQVLKDLNLITRYHYQLPSIYEIAGDAYLTLKQFSDAEIAYQSALQLGSKTPKAIINLANLILLRGDVNLCIHTLRLLDSKSISNDYEKSAYNALIGNIKEKKNSQIPFQIPE